MSVVYSRLQENKPKGAWYHKDVLEESMQLVSYAGLRGKDEGCACEIMNILFTAQLLLYPPPDNLIDC